DPEKAKFKSGDELLEVARTMSNRQTIFLDSTGRSYSIASHTFPSVRGMGEPLTGRLALKPDVSIPFMITGEDHDLILLASNVGFGFITEISNLFARSKNGKALITLGKDSALIQPEFISNPETDLILAITTAGRCLIFPVREMPRLEKGKGNKIIGIPGSELSATDGERLSYLKVFSCNSLIIIHAGKHSLKLNPSNQQNYHSKRGYRGKKLPRGYQSVTHIEIQSC
ncbi:MAG: DNA topoisomerase IV subunit A, partial [Desulfamplus sp.]|nr:DNA topoisomerase IV subunit A [Desulfamplus sp.]